MLIVFNSLLQRLFAVVFATCINFTWTHSFSWMASLFHL